MEEMDNDKMTVRYIKGVELRTNVFEAFDSFDGKSVLWNELPLPRLSTRSQEEATTKKKEEFELVHQNLDGNSEQFTVVLAWWNDRENMKLIWITEKSASLRSFLLKSNGVSCATIKKWSKKILLGLCKLHSKQIIHRDLRLDNIYYQSKSRSLKIGGFGMAKVVRKGQLPCSLKGTTHWMAPDFYTDKAKGYDRKVDIWAFGMCVLEMATMEVPYYAEFGNNEQEVQRAVKFVCEDIVNIDAGILPRALAKIKGPIELLEFIRCCLRVSPAERYTAKKLFRHSFLKCTPEDSKKFIELRTSGNYEKTLEEICVGSKDDVGVVEEARSKAPVSKKLKNPEQIDGTVSPGQDTNNEENPNLLPYGFKQSNEIITSEQVTPAQSPRFMPRAPSGERFLPEDDDVIISLNDDELRAASPKGVDSDDVLLEDSQSIGLQEASSGEPKPFLKKFPKSSLSGTIYDSPDTDAQSQPDTNTSPDEQDVLSTDPQNSPEEASQRGVIFETGSELSVSSAGGMDEADLPETDRQTDTTIAYKDKYDKHKMKYSNEREKERPHKHKKDKYIDTREKKDKHDKYKDEKYKEDKDKYREEKYKDEKYKDEKYRDRDKYKDEKYRDDKYKEKGKDSKDYKDKYKAKYKEKYRDKYKHKEREKDNKDKHYKDKYRDDKYREEKHRDDKYRDDKYREDKYREDKYRDDKYREDKEKYREDREKHDKYKDDKYREEKEKYREERDTRHKDDKYREDRHREDKYNDDKEKYREKDGAREKYDRQKEYKEKYQEKYKIKREKNKDKSKDKRDRHDKNYYEKEKHRDKERIHYDRKQSSDLLDSGDPLRESYSARQDESTRQGEYSQLDADGIYIYNYANFNDQINEQEMEQAEEEEEERVYENDDSTANRTSSFAQSLYTEPLLTSSIS